MTNPEDDEAYRRSVRRMALVLAAIVLVVFGAIFIPPLVNPLHEQFASRVSTNSPYGFSLNLSLNTTSVAPRGWVQFTAWLNNTSNLANNVTSQASWVAKGPESVPCFPTSPIRLGVMPGYYTSDNFSLGTILPLAYSTAGCPSGPVSSSPSYFLFEPEGSTALISSGGVIVRRAVSVSIASDGIQTGSNVSDFHGVVTAVAVDEWGDLVLTHFRVSS